MNTTILENSNAALRAIQENDTSDNRQWLGVVVTGVTPLLAGSDLSVEEGMMAFITNAVPYLYLSREALATMSMIAGKAFRRDDRAIKAWGAVLGRYTDTLLFMYKSSGFPCLDAEMAKAVEGTGAAHSIAFASLMLAGPDIIRLSATEDGREDMPIVLKRATDKIIASRQPAVALAH